METWKDIEGYEGLYQVSNTGKVKALERTVPHAHSKEVTKHERTLKPHLTKQGYLDVQLCKNGTVAHKRIHRLVAAAFVPNIEGKPFVNHKNGIKSDNREENLEWCTPSENIRHAVDVLGVSINKRTVKVMRSDGVVFDSIEEAAKTSETSHGNVWMVINGKRSRAKGYGFKLI